MGRYVDADPIAPACDVPWEISWLKKLGMAADPEPAWRARLLARRSAIWAELGDSPAALAELWEVIEELGLADAARRHIAHLRSARERWNTDARRRAS